MMQSVLLFIQIGHVYSHVYDHVYRSNVRYLYYNFDLSKQIYSSKFEFGIMVSVRVDPLARHLLGFQAYYITSVSRHGEVLLPNSDTAKIHMYKFQPDEKNFTKMWQKNRPQNISSMYIYDSEATTIVLQNHINKRTFLLSSTGAEQLQEWQQDNCLIGCWSNKRRVYLLKIKDCWKVCIVDDNNNKSYLRPSWLTREISVCEDELTGNKAVCYAPSGSTHTLEIFDNQGKLYHADIIHYAVTE